MWWSPDGQKLAYYRFDEQQGPATITCTLDQTQIQTTLDTEAYPEGRRAEPGRRSVRLRRRVEAVGARSTCATASRSTTPRSATTSIASPGRPTAASCSFNRTNRRQNIMELAAANPATGACRVVLREEWPTGWVTNRAARCCFSRTASASSGNRSATAGTTSISTISSGQLIAPLTTSTAFEVGGLVKSTSARARCSTRRATATTPEAAAPPRRARRQGRRRLTDPAFHHTSAAASVARTRPSNRLSALRHLADSSTSSTSIRRTTRRRRRGSPMPRTARSSPSSPRATRRSSTQLGLKKAELFTYTAADGKTTLRRAAAVPVELRSGEEISGCSSPSTADRSRQQHRARNLRHRRARSPNTASSSVNLDSRAVPGLGKRTLDAIYQKLGQAEIDDMAEGVKALWDRPYIDKDARRHLRHVVRRLCVGDGAAAPSRGLRGRVAPRRRRPTGATTTRSTPSATCGSRRRTRRATTPAAR